MDFADFMTYSATTVNNGLDMVNAGIAQYQTMGVEPPAELLIQQAQLEGTKESLTQLQKYAQGVNLLCNQDGLGVAPVIGVDWKFKNFNFAAKYEFKTQAPHEERVDRQRGKCHRRCQQIQRRREGQ